ncbi:hypothetical protein GDO78_011778 [Eleutherodactylus coqui]|uniref:MADF domain-containing protein n=1 Tax=Eleutherodactylus coqui TaxID=57060 RepID=A0A8J6K5G9_ELECQ|nr:hypothetical protein GDO78_011778 [Eleutherodactylus coqui]
MGRLIALMQDFPAIWDTNRSDYQDKLLKDKAWEDLSTQIYGEQWTTASTENKKNLLDEIKRKWRSARDQFRKEYTATTKSRAAVKRKRPYVYLQQLMYLAPTMEQRPSSDNLETVCDEEVEEGEQSVVATLPREDVNAGRDCKISSQVPALQTASTSPAVPRPRKLGRPTAASSQSTALASQQTDMQQQVLALLQQQTSPRNSAESFGQHVVMLLRSVPENLQLATQNYMLYLLEMSSPPNSPYELHYTIDQYRCRQSQRQCATEPPAQTPPPQPTPPR